MTFDEVVSEIEAIRKEAPHLPEHEVVGKRGRLAGLHRQLGGLEPDRRREAGRLLNEARDELERWFAEVRAERESLERAARLAADRLDLTEVPPDPFGLGHVHLVTQTQQILEDLFVGMGFTVSEEIGRAHV